MTKNEHDSTICPFHADPYSRRGGSLMSGKHHGRRVPRKLHHLGLGTIGRNHMHHALLTRKLSSTGLEHLESWQSRSFNRRCTITMAAEKHPLTREKSPSIGSIYRGLKHSTLKRDARPGGSLTLGKGWSEACTTPSRVIR
jgi:hypothetical protein